MKASVNLVLSLVIVLVIASCKGKGSTNTFKISGTITNSNAKTVYLEEMPMGTLEKIVIGSAPIGEDGKYSIETEQRESTIFSLRLDQNEMPSASVVNDSKDIT